MTLKKFNWKQKLWWAYNDLVQHFQYVLLYKDISQFSWLWLVNTTKQRYKITKIQLTWELSYIYINKMNTK